MIKIEELLVEPDPKQYFFIAQGMITIDNVDDAEEMRMTDESFDILNFTQVNLIFSYRKLIRKLFFLSVLNMKHKRRKS